MKNLLAWLATLGAIVIFLFSCFVAAADGQGAMLFIVTFPVLFFLLYLAIINTRKDQGAVQSIWKTGAFWFSRATLVVSAAFLVFAFVPGLNLFTTALIGGVSFAFEGVTGKSPYTWVRERNHISVKIAKALKQSNGQKLDMRDLSVSYQWDKVCFFGPYTTDEAAQKVLQLSYDWKLSANSKVGLSDGVNALVFLHTYNKGGVSYVVDLNRAEADFVKLSGQCILKENANFVKAAGQGAEFQFGVE